MSLCTLCKKPIPTGKAAVSVVGGLFPDSDPDFFMVDEQVLKESHAHLECLLKAIGGKPNDPRSSSGTG